MTLPIHGYRYLISPLIGPRCRFLPTCSDYALEAIGRHGIGSGIYLTVKRVARCHPFGGSGYDPVPEVRPHHEHRSSEPAAPR